MLADRKMSPNAFDRHATVVADVHDDVKHAPRLPPPPRSSPAVAVGSPTPKLSPETVSDAYPLCGAFSCTAEAAATSKLKIGDPVPDTDATVTLAARNKSAAAFDRHASVVADVQDDVKHAPRSPPPPRSSPAVAVGSPTPKSSPDTVTDAYPLIGEFSRASDATAASKLYTALAVPATPPTLTADTPYVVLTPLLKHPSVVADVHVDVLHTAISSAPVALRSTEPKLSPATVKELPPLTAEFCNQPDPTAASKLYPTTCVPTTPPTLTLDVCAPVVVALDTHPKLVADVHVDVLHAPSESDTLALGSHTPKLSPATVTELLPLSAKFG